MGGKIKIRYICGHKYTYESDLYWFIKEPNIYVYVSGIYCLYSLVILEMLNYDFVDFYNVRLFFTDFIVVIDIEIKKTRRHLN